MKRLLTLLICLVCVARVLAQVGSWTNVTPGGITLNPDGTYAGTGQNFGVQGTALDLAHPGTVYVGVTYQGLWKSTDYGVTWTHVTVTSGPTPMDCARPEIAIAADSSYMISTALYPSGCSGLANGAWKSTDLGLTWTRYTTGMPSEDPGHFNIDPNNVLRVAGTPHTPPGDLWESRDGGQTWTDMGGVCGTEGMVDSLAAKFWWIDEDHLLAVGGGDNTEAYGTCLGTRSGSTWPWTWSWVKVNTNQHFHAEEQVYFDPANGTIVEGGAFGIDVSTDHGVTWTAATMPDSYSSSIVGTATTLYSTANYASLGGFAPNYATASRSAPLTWTAGTLPSGMNNGWLNASVMCSGSNYIIVAGCWDAGLWRYVEPSTGACPGTVTSPKRIRFIKVG